MKIITLLAAFLFSISGFSQRWTEMMQDPDANFYDIQKAFEAYWSTRIEALDKMKLAQQGKITLSDQEKAQTAGWKQFKRWEWFMEPRVSPTGERFAPDIAYNEIRKERQKQKMSNQSLTGNWVALGPTNVPSNGGAGRINCVRFDPNNSSIVYAGSASGGLWKSTNGGTGWTMWNTDALGSLGVTDIAVDPNDSQIIYLATGDGDASDTYSVGLLKSTDGGATWNTTGMNWTVTQVRTIRKILLDPANTQVIHVGASNGIWKSTDGGAAFTQSSTTAVKDMEFKPGDPTVIYASTTTAVYKSTNSGQSYASIYSVSGAERLAIAVTAANPAYVYVLASQSSDSGFLGFYRSTNDGGSFTLMSSTPNILGWSNAGSDSGGQGWYDLALAASPTSANEVVIGGVNIWKSTNGGSNWSIIGHWTGSGAPYVHADIHDLIYLNGTTIYSGCDGGVFRTQNSGTNWSDMSNGLQIGQMYKLGQSASNGTLLLTGLQDNGTDKLNGTTWTRAMGGDGMECFVDRTNNSIMYAEYYNGDFRRSTNGGTNWSSIQNGLTGTGAWVTPWCQDPVNANTLWAAYDQVFQSTDQGSNWTQMGTITGTSKFRAIEVAPTNNQVIYILRTKNVYKSSDGGNTWTDITAGLPLSGLQLAHMTVDPADANHVYVTYTGYSAATKVYVTTNGGSTWTNYSTGLPNLPVNCIVYEKNSNGGVYAGTDIGVYYRDATMSSWTNFSTNLPNVIVSELEIHYGVSKIRAASYGRGMWESDLYSNATAVQDVKSCIEDCFRLYPNPNSGNFQVVNGLSETIFVEVHNMLGERIFSAESLPSAEPITINLNDSGKGIYIVTLKDNATSIQKKVVVM